MGTLECIRKSTWMNSSRRNAFASVLWQLVQKPDDKYPNGCLLTEHCITLLYFSKIPTHQEKTRTFFYHFLSITL